MRTWMVEQLWAVGDMTVPIRSVVEAKTRKGAQKGAEAACKVAHEKLAEEHGIRGGQPASKAQVLYAIG